MDALLIGLMLVAGFSLAAYRAERGGRLPSFVSVQGPFILLHSSRGKATIDALAVRFERFWRCWGVLGVVLTGMGLIVGGVLVVLSAVSVILRPEASDLASDPKNFLVIPGVNDYLPLEAAPELVIALFIGMVVHEFGHAVLCRLGDIDIKSTGVVLLAVLPAGAFVEPDPESQEAASRWARIRMISGGIMNNVAVALLAFVLLTGLVLPAIAPADGGAVGGVLAGSPAAESGMESGDRIVAVNGRETGSNNAVLTALHESRAKTVEVTLANGDTHTVNRAVFVTAAPADGTPLTTQDRVLAVNGNEVATVGAFLEELQGVSAPTATLETDHGTVTHQVGARVLVSSDSPLRDGFDDRRLVITHINGVRVHHAASFRDVLKSVSGGAVTVTAMPVGASEQQKTVEVTVPDDGGLGVTATKGVAGVEVADTGVTLYPTERYLSLLGKSGGDAEFNPLTTILVLLLLPFATTSGLPFNFAGFTPEVANFVTVTGVLSPVAGVVLFFASVLFWTVWLNLNLALFNAIPMVALDGGQYFTIVVESTFDRLRLPNPKRMGKRVTQFVIYGMLALLLIMVLLPSVL